MIVAACKAADTIITDSLADLFSCSSGKPTRAFPVQHTSRRQITQVGHFAVCFVTAESGSGENKWAGFQGVQGSIWVKLTDWGRHFVRALDRLSLGLIYSPPSSRALPLLHSSAGMPLMKLLWSPAVEFYHVSPSPHAPGSLSPMCNVSKRFGLPASQELLHSDRIDADSGDVSQSGCGRVEAPSLSDARWVKVSSESHTWARGFNVLPANASLFLAGCQTAHCGSSLGLWEVNIQSFSLCCHFAGVEEKEEMAIWDDWCWD